MEKRLEDFIRDNKKDFNDAVPPDGLWEKIGKKLEEQNSSRLKNAKVVKLSLILQIAASVSIVIAASMFLWQYQYKQATDLANIDPALARQQLHYASVIEIKRSELRSLEKEEPQLYNEFSSEIRKMDESYQRLVKDLPESPNQEETVKAMIQNLQTQTEVLNQQLIVIKQINDSKKQDNETQSI
ncbi:MAG: hypothetical protein H7096_02015 [Flavobacterium sp.]|nr:hypothetical protein [Pedobacter sp.]